MSITKEQVEAILSKVVEQNSQKDIISVGMISGIYIKDDAVSFAIEGDANSAERLAPIKQRAEAELLKHEAVSKVNIVLTSEVSSDSAKRPAIAANWSSRKIPGIEHIIAVSSGKGGVGKSTTTVNLAYALASLKLKVGILDADIYGPSIPLMLGLTDKGQPSIRAGKMMPWISDGIKSMSIGYIMSQGGAVAWRGPMISKALNQMLFNSDWGEVDVMLIDMPPGTGDVQLTIAQQTPIDGAIIITTPQMVASQDAEKSIDTLRKTQIPLLGIIENMSGFIDNDGNKHELFAGDGGKQLANRYNSKLIGKIALVPAITNHLEKGRNFIGQNKADNIAQEIINEYKNIASHLVEHLYNSE